ncbi:MAG TPA: two-component regulator propeller domain-containing protein, partial [Bacteroidia bacterium]|nr:two-component regulator propeller domain-containing protein [Bacteroidia bacterium]
MFYNRLYLVFFLCLCCTKIFSQSYNFKNYSVEHGLTYIHICDIFQDDKGYLWTGGYGGLSRFDGNKFVNYSPRNGLIHYSVQSITQGPAGNLIIGTIEGLSVFNGKRFTNYTRKDGLTNEHVNCLAVAGNKIAIGTDTGLYYLQNSKITAEPALQKETIKKIRSWQNNFTGITTKKLFSLNNGVYSVLFSFSDRSDTLMTCFELDKNNNLWLGTNKGLFKIEKQK